MKLECDKAQIKRKIQFILQKLGEKIKEKDNIKQIKNQMEITLKNVMQIITSFGEKINELVHLGLRKIGFCDNRRMLTLKTRRGDDLQEHHVVSRKEVLLHEDADDHHEDADDDEHDDEDDGNGKDEDVEDEDVEDENQN